MAPGEAVGALAGTEGGLDHWRGLVDCPDCGLRHHVPPLGHRASARCARCHGLLRRTGSSETGLALALAGLVLIALANLLPLLTLEVEGRSVTASLASGALILAARGLWLLGALILLLTVVAPVLKLGGIAFVLLGLRARRPPRAVIPVLRSLDRLSAWAMVEVYLLGMFVAYVKLAAFATVVLGVAVYALAALMVVMAAMDAALDFDGLWEDAEAKGVVRVPPAPLGAPLARCPVCGLLAALAPHRARCPRCRAALHRRKPDSAARCWALILTAAILYVPANVYPIMTVISFGAGAPDTILSGVKHLVQAGMWPLALLVFFASITVPVLKIGGLGVLLIMTQIGSRSRLRDRTRLYRIIEAVGRWSMIDIFMLSILVALVRFGTIASVAPGIGALSFAAVVVLTMLAAASFDPRLMWDRAGENR